MRRGPSAFNRLSIALGMVFLYAPMALLVLYSFNAGRLVTVWSGFSTRCLRKWGCRTVWPRRLRGRLG